MARPQVNIRNAVGGDADAHPSILFIGCGPIWSGGAGYLLRQRMFVDALRAIGRVRMVVLDADGGLEAPADWNATIVAFPTRIRAGRARRVFEGAMSGTSPAMRGWRVEDVRRAVRAAGPHGHDAVFAYRIDHAFFAGVIGHQRLLLDIDDPEHVRRRRRASVAGDIDRRQERELASLEAFERQAVMNARASFVCQAGDAAHFPGSSPIVVPNCVEIPESVSWRGQESSTLVIVGNFAGSPDSPNVDGLRWFLSEVWPRLVERHPAARVDVIGRIGEALASEVSAHDGVRVRGFVASLADVFADAAMSVAPIRFGTGTRVKIIESMAHGCPVVTTTPGFDGIDAAGGEDLVIGDGAEGLADACVGLLEDRELLARVGAAGRMLAESRFDRRTEHDRLVRILVELVGDRGRRTEAAA